MTYFFCKECRPKSTGGSTESIMIMSGSCYEVGRNKEIHWEEFSTMDSTIQQHFRLRSLNQNWIDEWPRNVSIPALCAIQELLKEPLNKHLWVISPSSAPTYLADFLTELSHRPEGSEVQVFDDNFPLWCSLFPDVPGGLLSAPHVSAGHDDPGLKLQQFAGQSFPDATVSPGDEHCLSAHGIGCVAEQLVSFLPWEDTAQKKQQPAADNRSYKHRSGHECGERCKVRASFKNSTAQLKRRVTTLTRKYLMTPLRNGNDKSILKNALLKIYKYKLSKRLMNMVQINTI